MRWYIRDIDNGKIFGPFDYDDALDCGSRLDNGAIFNDSALGGSSEDSSILQKCPGTHLETKWQCPNWHGGSWHSLVIDSPDPNNIDGCDELHAGDEIGCSTCDWKGFGSDISTGSVSPQQIVHISIEGGVAEVDSVPDGVQVIIRDYDTEGTEPSPERPHFEDERGTFVESTYGH